MENKAQPSAKAEAKPVKPEVQLKDLEAKKDEDVKGGGRSRARVKNNAF